MAIEENAENMQDVISQHFMQRMDFANPCSMAYYPLWPFLSAYTQSSENFEVLTYSGVRLRIIKTPFM